MGNTTLTADVIAKEAVMILDNELVMGNKVHRGYEEEFNKKVNGYKTGESITIRKPADFVVTDGAVMDTQDVTEGTTAFVVNKRKHVAFEFTSQDLTLSISKMSERVIKPAMIQLANQVDLDVMNEYKNIPNWVGNPGQLIDSWDDFAAAGERLDEFGVPSDDRFGLLSPADKRKLVGAQTGLYNGELVKSAYRRGLLGNVDNVDTYMSQNVQTHTVGVATGTPKINGADQKVEFEAVKDNWQQVLNTDGWTVSTTGILKAGDVFTIAGVYAVNSVTKQKLPFLRQFVVLADADSGASSGPAALTVSPPIITEGPQQTVSDAPADNANITVKGSGGESYRQNLVLHKNALGLVMVPLVAPPGATEVGRRTYKGLSVRVIPVYDGINDVSKWRLDILYGTKTLDHRLAARLNG